MHELGHEHFQAPRQLNIRQFDSQMDRFPALVIYLSLLALNEDSRLWDKCRANDETKLLLGAEDFRDLRNSSAYKLLRQVHKTELQVCLDELASSIYDRRTPKSLREVLHSTPQDSIPTVTLPRYEAPPIGIVLPPEPYVTPQPQRPTTPFMSINTIPIPTSYLQSPAQDQPPPPDPTQTQRSKINPAVWWLLAFAILTFVFAIAYHAAWLIVTLVLLIAMPVVGRKKRK